jgi:spore coat polysaccharide biosynthesis predicted glycosyltransferase SpsG
MNKVIIRTLGGKAIGYGHYYRCLSLAKAIQLIEKDIDIIFLVNQELENLISKTKFKFMISNDLDEDNKKIYRLYGNLFIFDSYLGNNEYLKEIKKRFKLMLIDDNNDIYDSSIPDIIYNGNIYSQKLNYNDYQGQLKLLGSKYLIMKEEYWNISSTEHTDRKGILVTTGGTDEYEISLKIIDEIKDLNSKIKVIIGPGYKENYIKKIKNLNKENMELIYKPDSLKDYIASSEIIITAGGSTVYEILSQRRIPIIFSMADNQDLICRELNLMGVEFLGKYPKIEYNRLKQIIYKLQLKRSKLSGNIFNMINNRGAILVAKEIIRYIKK